MLTYDLKQSTPNAVIVEVGAVLDDTVQYGSLTIHIDPEFKPTEHARIYGVVKAVPKGKCYNEETIEIEQEVMVGDKIYFHYLTTSDETNRIYGNYYRVPYFWIFCIVRDSRIIPVGGWSLCEQITEQEESFNEVQVGNQKISAILSASGLVTGIQKKKSERYARLAHIGKPLVGRNILNVNVGDEVIINKNSHFKNKIEGKDYYTVRQDDILGKVLNL
jgi:co-chaperonin GroES (HSP10)